MVLRAGASQLVNRLEHVTLVSRLEPSELVGSFLFHSSHGVLQTYLERFVEDLSIAYKVV